MDTIIRQIIDADKEARQKVAHAKEELKKSKSIFNDDLVNIKNEFEQLALNVVEQKEISLEKKYQEHFKMLNDSFNDSYSKLESQFASNREQWISSIVKSCFDI